MDSRNVGLLHRTPVLLFLSIFVILWSCGGSSKHASVTGVWSGTYSWDCSSANTGSIPIVLTLTQEGNSISGTAAYANDVSALAGTVDGDSVTIEVSGTAAITPNRFRATATADGLSGSAAFGENCSSPSGAAGTVSLARQPAAAGAAARIAVVGPAAVAAGSCSGAFTVEARNDAGSPAAPASDAGISLTGAGSGAFYADSDCRTAVEGIKLPHGGFSRSFYFRSAVVETTTVRAVDRAGVLGESSMPVGVFASRAQFGFDRDGTPVDFSVGAAARVQQQSSQSLVEIWGVDDAGNQITLFVPFGADTFTCASGVTIYYQEGQAQWAGYEGHGVCSVTVTSLGGIGQPVEGSFSGSLTPLLGGASGSRTLANGNFFLVRILP